MIEKLDSLSKDFDDKVKLADDEPKLLNLKSEFLGKSGLLSEVLKGLRNATSEERKVIGPKANALKNFINTEVHKKIQELEVLKINENLKISKNLFRFFYMLKHSLSLFNLSFCKFVNSSIKRIFRFSKN